MTLKRKEPSRTCEAPYNRSVLEMLAVGLRLAAYHRRTKLLEVSQFIDARRRTVRRRYRVRRLVAVAAVRDLLGHPRRRRQRPAPDAAVYAHRDAEFVLNVHGRWENTADDARCIG